MNTNILGRVWKRSMPWLHERRGLLLMLMLVVAQGTDAALGQITWRASGSPAERWASYCYDDVRDRLVMFAHDGFTGITYEYNAALGPSRGWTSTLVAPDQSTLHGGVAYDRLRQRVVCYDGMVSAPGSRTWEWNGITWTEAARNHVLWFEHVVGHSQRGTVIAFGGGYYTGTDLYEWDGAAWNILPQSSRPPRPWNGGSYLGYLSAAYDARRYKLVLFGTADLLLAGGYTNPAPTIWEWDAAQGWTTRTVAFPMTVRPAMRMTFDAHRGVLLATINYYPQAMRTFEWDGGPAWRELVAVHPPPPANFNSLGLGHDSRRGQTHVILRDLNSVYYRCSSRRSTTRASTPMAPAVRVPWVRAAWTSCSRGRERGSVAPSRSRQPTCRRTSASSCWAGRTRCRGRRRCRLRSTATACRAASRAHRSTRWSSCAAARVGRSSGCRCR